MPNRLGGEGPVISIVHTPVTHAIDNSETSNASVTPVGGLNLYWQVPPRPYSDGVIIKRFCAMVDGTEVGTATLSVDLQVGATVAGLTTVLDAILTFTAEGTAVTEGVLVTTDAYSAVNPNLGGVPGTVVAPGSYVGIIFSSGGTWSDVAYFPFVMAQIDYVPWNAVQPSLAPGQNGNV